MDTNWPHCKKEKKRKEKKEVDAEKYINIRKDSLESNSIL